MVHGCLFFLHLYRFGPISYLECRTTFVNRTYSLHRSFGQLSDTRLSRTMRQKMEKPATLNLKMRVGLIAMDKSANRGHNTQIEEVGAELFRFAVRSTFSSVFSRSFSQNRAGCNGWRSMSCICRIQVWVNVGVNPLLRSLLHILIVG